MNPTSIWKVLRKYVVILISMKRTKWSVGMRNQLSSLAMSCDSCSAVEDAKISEFERKYLQEALMKVVDWIDSKIK